MPILDDYSGVPHPEGTDVQVVPVPGTDISIYVPSSHDGSKIKVELPDGSYAYTDGFDPSERAIAGERPVVPCGNCGAPQTLVSNEFDCSACGAHNSIELRTSTDTGEGTAVEAG